MALSILMLSHVSLLLLWFCHVERLQQVAKDCSSLDSTLSRAQSCLIRPEITLSDLLQGCCGFVLAESQWRHHLGGRRCVEGITSYAGTMQKY